MTSRVKSLLELERGNAGLLANVRRLVLIGDFQRRRDPPSLDGFILYGGVLTKLLPLLTGLHSLTLRNTGVTLDDLDWHIELGDRIRTQLMHLLSLPSFVNLKLHNVRGFPWWAMGGTRVEKLSLGWSWTIYEQATLRAFSIPYRALDSRGIVSAARHLRSLSLSAPIRDTGSETFHSRPILSAFATLICPTSYTPLFPALKHLHITLSYCRIKSSHLSGIFEEHAERGWNLIDNALSHPSMEKVRVKITLRMQVTSLMRMGSPGGVNGGGGGPMNGANGGINPNGATTTPPALPTVTVITDDGQPQIQTIAQSPPNQAPIQQQPPPGTESDASVPAPKPHISDRDQATRTRILELLKEALPRTFEVPRGKEARDIEAEVLLGDKYAGLPGDEE